MKTLFLALMLIIPISATAAPAFTRVDERDRSRADGYVTVSGTVTDINNRSAVFELQGRNRSNYTIRADEAEILVNGKRAGFSSLREDQSVTVYGWESSNRTIDADSVEIQDRDRRDGDYNDRYDDSRDYRDVGKIVTLRGSVDSINNRTNRVYMNSDRGRTEVIVSKKTDIREYGKRRNIDDIRDGDYLVATGKLQTSSTLEANTVTIGGPDSGRRDVDSILSGVVVRDTNIYNRTLVVRTSLGEKKVDVPRGAEVRIDGFSASVHDVKEGDLVRAVGRWSGDKYEASQLMVNRTNNRGDYAEVLDITRDQLRVQIGSKRYTVYTDKSDIRFDDGRRADLSDLRNGDRIKIYGDTKGDKIYADRIDIVRRYR